MKLRIKHTYLVVLYCLLQGMVAKSQQANQLFQQMLEQIDSLKTIEFNLTIEERLDQGWFKGVSFAKIDFHPYRLYMYQHAPNKGLELILNEKLYGEKAVVNTNTFPYINMWLSPFSNMMRKSKHHTLYEASVFKYMGNILKNMVNNHSNDFVLLDSGMVKINGIVCNKLVIKVPGFGIKDYIVQEGENIYEIGTNNYVEDYKILLLNENIEDFYDISAGQKIKITNSYAKKIILYIDPGLLLPFYIKIYDEVGLYEKYYFEDLKINLHYKDEEFEKEYGKYSF